jgi:uncharacterized damage-inducible protein DinB
VPGLLFGSPAVFALSIILFTQNLDASREDAVTIVRRLPVLVAFLILAAAAIAQTAAQVNSVLDMPEFVRDWQISKQFTIDVANAMPAEFYSFKPNPEEMTFGEQMIHIAGSNVFRFNQITGIKPPFPFDPAKPPASDKQNVLKLLDQSFDYVIDVLPKITPQQLQRTWHIPSWKGRNDPDGRAMIVNMFVHTAHHRAQCDVYLRAKGTKPPDYTF